MQHEIEYQQHKIFYRPQKRVFLAFMVLNAAARDCELSQLLKTTLIGNRSPKTLSMVVKMYIRKRL